MIYFNQLLFLKKKIDLPLASQNWRRTNLLCLSMDEPPLITRVFIHEHEH